MFSLESEISRKIFNRFVIGLTAWLFACVCWITVTNRAQLAQDSRHAARELLGKEGGDIVCKTSQAVTVINAVAIAKAHE